MYVRRAADAASAARRRPMRMNGAVWLQSWTSSSSTGSTSSTCWIQLLTASRSGTRPPASMARWAAIRSGEAEPAVSASVVSAWGVGVQCGAAGAELGAGGGGAAGAVDADRRQRPFRQRGRLGPREQGVGGGGAAHGLGGVVDEDVERALGGDVVGERDDLGGVAQVDADDAQAVQPVGAVGHGGEAAGGVAREARRDRRVRAVAQQPQRDVHADLGAAAGEQRAAAVEVRAGVAAGVVAGRAGRTELVVEGVDLDVALLADVARAGLDERAGAAAVGLRCEREAGGLVVDAAVGAGGGGGGDRGVAGEDGRAALGAAAQLDGLEEPGGGVPDGDRVGVLGGEVVELRDRAQAGLEVGGVDARPGTWGRV